MTNSLTLRIRNIVNGVIDQREGCRSIGAVVLCWRLSL